MRFLKKHLLVVLWTERIGPAAAIKTLKIMKKYKSWKRLQRW